MKPYIHARLRADDRTAIEDLKRSTGETESEIIRRGIRLVVQEERQRRTALDLAGPGVGRFAKGPRTLSTLGKHLEGFGE